MRKRFAGLQQSAIIMARRCGGRNCNTEGKTRCWISDPTANAATVTCRLKALKRGYAPSSARFARHVQLTFFKALARTAAEIW